MNRDLWTTITDTYGFENLLVVVIAEMMIDFSTEEKTRSRTRDQCFQKFPRDLIPVKKTGIPEAFKTLKNDKGRTTLLCLLCFFVYFGLLFYFILCWIEIRESTTRICQRCIKISGKTWWIKRKMTITMIMLWFFFWLGFQKAGPGNHFNHWSLLVVATR